MVTDEERDYMYRAYANDPQMRVIGNPPEIGVTLGKDWNQIELMNALLFSLRTPSFTTETRSDGRQHLPRRSQRVRTPCSGAPTECRISKASPHRCITIVIDPTRITKRSC